MKILIKMELSRMLRQKYLWIFIGAFAFAAFAYSFLLATPVMYDRLNVDPIEASGAAFPLFMLPFYANIVGPLFLSFITAIVINEEGQSGMLRQPLLHGHTRRQILNAKLLMLGMTALVNVIVVFLISYGFGWLRWGSVVFSAPQFEKSVRVYILVVAALLVTQVLTITVALFAKCSLYTVIVMFVILLADNAFNRNFPLFSARFNYAYYPSHYLNSDLQAVMPELSPAIGLLLAVVWLAGLYLISRKRIGTMDFTV